MKRFALTLALLLTAGSAAANDFGAIFYVVKPRETVVYNQAANCVDEVGTTLKAAPVVPSIALVCQTQQWTQPSPGRSHLQGQGHRKSRRGPEQLQLRERPVRDPHDVSELSRDHASQPDRLLRSSVRVQGLQVT